MRVAEPLQWMAKVSESESAVLMCKVVHQYGGIKMSGLVQF